MDAHLCKFAYLTEIQNHARENATSCALWFDLSPQQVEYILSLNTSQLVSLAARDDVVLKPNISPEAMKEIEQEIDATGRLDHAMLKYIDGRTI